MDFWQNSSVMAEFEKIAAEQGLITTNFNPKDKDFVGNASKPVPTGNDYTRMPKTEDYGVTKDDDIIGRAHPKDARMADAMGDGALVENIKQQQEKDLEIATRMPSGALFGIHASVVNSLIKLANDLDNQEKYKEAQLIDNTLKNLRPFANSYLRKEAFAPLVWLGSALMTALKAGTIGAATIGSLRLFGAKLITQQENLREDLKDLYDALLDLSPRSQAAASSAKKLAPFSSELIRLDVSTAAGKQEYNNFLQKLGPVLTDIGTDLPAIIQTTGEESGFLSKIVERGRKFLGVDALKLLQERWNDAKKSYQEALQLSQQAEQIKTTIEQNIKPETNISDLQNLLFSEGVFGQKFQGSITNTLDENTVSALHNLERILAQTAPLVLSRQEREELGTVDFTNKLISTEGKLLQTPEKIRHIVELFERALNKTE